MRAKWTRLIAHVVGAGAIGFATGKLLPAKVVLAAALAALIWACFSLWQIKRKLKQLEEITGKWK